MRIKSYFDSSVQTAMRQARHEFGDDVILVTSRATSLECRHLGDYEVVFAVDERETTPDEHTEPLPEATGFEQIFRQQLMPATRCIDSTREGIDTIHSQLMCMGLEPAVTEALTVLIRSFVPLPEQAPPAQAGGTTSVGISGAYDWPASI